MIVGTVLLRDGGLQAEPGWRELGLGILVHMSADFSGPWCLWCPRPLDGRLGPWALLPIALLWAPLTSSIE